MSTPLYQSTLTSLPKLSAGKVRDIYAVGNDKMLIVTSDRLSAFDVILDDPIPHKGAVLTGIANFWFDRLQHVVPNHLTGIDPCTVVSAEEQAQVAHRAIVVKKLMPLPIEAVVRGYLIGSGWKDYQQSGAVCGIQLPAGLQQASRLPAPIFTPATKAAVGEHDENVDFTTAALHCQETLATFLAGTRKTGAQLCREAMDVSIKLYEEASAYARTRGILIADTKFEFGVDAAGTLHLIDEVLTPDSSRFWAADSWRENSNPPSYDKQPVRDYLETLTWNKKAPAPKLPAEIISATSERYIQAFECLSGQSRTQLGA